MNSNKTLKQIENEINYLETLVTVQNEPYRYNWLSMPINENIQKTLNWIDKQWEKSSVHEIKHAFDLLNKCIKLLERFYKIIPIE